MKKADLDCQIDEIASQMTDYNVGLERAQRILLGLDDEEMPFDETTLASLLHGIANQTAPLSDEFIALHSIANALSTKDKDWVLTLKNKKQGKWESPYEHSAKHYRDSEILHVLAHAEKSGWKTEAAVMAIADRYDLSRASVFAAVKRAETFLSDGRKIFPDNENFDNPRSKVSDK